eukprot:3673217-Ditylum_brightwellii.AAC.1
MLPFLHGWPKEKTSMTPLFDAMHEAGFVSAYVQDDCHSSLAPKHSNIAHHTPNQAWCIAQKEWGYWDGSEDTRCIGDRPSNAHAFEYIQRFLDTYKDNARYVFAHLGDGHEVSGTVIRSVDLSLHTFLQETLKKQRKHSNTIILISSDHGMRYGGWRRSASGFLEHKLPPLFIIMPRQMQTNAPAIYAALRHNTKLLITKLDLHMTLKHLLRWPLQPLETKQQAVGVSLLMPLSYDRT